jgi:biopolymer transport protein ExbD
MKFPSRRRSKPKVLLTSLIDIVFLLLVFFLLTSSFVDQQGVSILVPEVETEGSELSHDIEVSIDKHGLIYFKNIKVNEAILLNLIKTELTDSPNLNVAIRADRKAQYDSIVRVIDIAKNAGAKNFLLITQTQ